MKINSPLLYRSEVRRCNLPRHYRSSIVSASIAKRYNRATDPGQRKKKKRGRSCWGGEDADGPSASFPQGFAINSTRAGSISIEPSSIVEVLSNYRSYRRYEREREPLGPFRALYDTEMDVFIVSRGAERSAGRHPEIEGRQWRCEQRKQSRLTFMNRIPTPRCIQMADKGESPISYLMPTLLATPEG